MLGSLPTLVVLLSVSITDVDAGLMWNRTRLVGALWNLEKVSECVLHYTALAYNDYGCWCGVGGAHTPMDGIDECCMHHDKCYDAAVDTRLCYNVPEEYVDDYSWQCADGECHCKDPIDPPTTCAAAMCACDKAVVDCWHQYPRPASKAKCNHIDRAFANHGKVSDTFRH